MFYQREAALAVALLAVFCLSGVYGLEVNVVTPTARPTGSDSIQIQAQVDGSSNVSVTLVYVTNYGSEKSITMSQSDGSLYTATIPASDAPSGAMVRWFVQATDSSRNTARAPSYENSEAQQYYGTVVQDTSSSSSLPVVDLYCKDSRAPFNPSKDSGPQCSMLFEGEFYDNFSIRRKGQSSLNWPKPKFKISATDTQGKIFKISPSAKRVKQINFNSEWFEPGENTFMRETLAWETLRQMGVDYLTSYQTVVRLNGQYFGKFALGVDWTSDQLETNGYTTQPNSPRFKSESGEYSNLRWDIPSDQVQYYYTQETDQIGSEGDAALVSLGRGLAGGGSLPRSNYIFEMINLPKTINYMAAMTVMLNQDRCTKNFEVYLDPSSEQWSMLPWDLESSYGIDRGLDGQPAADYCILACEQWNSPLYCDSNHPQDLAVTTPWGLITTQINPANITAAGGPSSSSASSPSSGRRLMQSGGGGGEKSGTASNGAAEPGLSLPSQSAISQDYNEDQTKKGATLTGAPGTFNYLIDAILEVPRTRAMYMRRLRTLMDSFMATGKLQELVTAEYNKIREEAKKDAEKWGNPGDPDRGYQQLITEQLPIRKEQLFNKYSMGSDTPLIPSSQSSDAQSSVSIGSVSSGNNGYVQVKNNNEYAVDVSGWTLNGSGISFTCTPGTVIPPKDSVFIAATSVKTFKQRGGSPKGGQGLFVVGPLSGTPDGSTSISISSA